MATLLNKEDFRFLEKLRQRLSYAMVDIDSQIEGSVVL